MRPASRRTSTARVARAACCLLAAGVLAGRCPPRAVGAAEPVTAVTVDCARSIARVPAGLYGVGYNGWGDTVYPQAVAHLRAVGVRYVRMVVCLDELCGDRPGDYRWEYAQPCDLGEGFLSRMRRIRRQGWTPILAFSLHGAAGMLPRWFHGEHNDARGNAWFRYHGDGTLAPDGKSDQYQALSRIARDLAAKLAAEGLTGLHWESIYEMGHDMPLADIHYHVARGIRAADPRAKLLGPATWPGWTVEERFVKPFLATYGADLLDYVTMHWYADNEHGLWRAPGYQVGETILTMGQPDLLAYLMETTPKFGAWCRRLRALLDDPALNPTRKRIGIAFTEFDAVARSPYGSNPENPDWPRYRADADCYLNTNVFGGVWCASVLCHLAASGCLDIALKFNARQYYGLIDNGPGQRYFRQPVWFAWRLLQERAGLKPGAPLLATTVDGPRDNAAAHVDGQDTPWVEAFAVGPAARPRLVLINRSFTPQTVRLRLSGTPARRTTWRAERYRFSEERVARFIGRKPGTRTEGAFAGAPDDSASARCLRRLDQVTARREGSTYRLEGLHCPPISITVLAFQ